MFRTLLTPLRARFDLSPRSPSISSVSPYSPYSSRTDDILSPEDFAKDVLIELMKQSVDNLKGSEDGKSRTEGLAEIQRIMLQDPCTKDVFREFDGFLVLINALTAMQTICEGPVVEPADQVLSEILESARLVFMIISDAMDEHVENSEYFEKRVGYEVLSQAVRDLVSGPKTMNETLGFLMSFALHDFSLSGIFTTLRGVEEAEVDLKLNEIDSRLGIIRRPGAIGLLWSFASQVTANDNRMRYGVYKLFERLAYRNHRNQAILSSLGLVKSIFDNFYNNRENSAGAEKSRHPLQKLLRRLLDLGATTAEARVIFQKIIKDNDKLDGDVLELVRAGMKARWPKHFSLESRAAFVLTREGLKGLPATGFTYMTWIWIEKLPVTGSHAIFAFRLSSRLLLTMGVRHDGKLDLRAGDNDEAVFDNASITRSRWTHIVLVHYPHKVGNPSIRLFVDGGLNSTLNWTYPKSETTAQVGTYTIGDESRDARMSWCIASAYLLSIPIADDLPRLVHHLGPRYCGNFQDPGLVRFLTYEASTSLNMYLSTMVSKKPTSPAEVPPLLRAVKNGLGLDEIYILFSLSPLNPLQTHSGVNPTISSNAFSRQNPGIRFEVQGDVFVVKASCLDMALWKIGGAAITLRLVQLANTPHEVSRALGILTDGLRNNWQNSEDMERLRGYEILADILRTKSQMINMTGFETLFEFLGLNFRSPEQSALVNVVAYRAIALDFELWSRTRKEIQRVHLEHFTTLMDTSRFKKFNTSQRIVKMNIVRKLLFVLQIDWYQADTVPFVIEALAIAARAHFSKDEAIKPLVAFLAANLQEDSTMSGSPKSTMSRFDFRPTRGNAEQVLNALVSILSSPAFYSKFTAALPLVRIALLLLGDQPSPAVARQVLILIGISLSRSSSFSRKFELISGWSILKTVIPSAWDSNVHEAAFDILLGRPNVDNKAGSQDSNTVVCTHIVPVIFGALNEGLDSVAKRSQPTDDNRISGDGPLRAIDGCMETLVEELMALHASSNTFRQVFRSQQTTQLFINAYKSFVSKAVSLPDNSQVDQNTIRILEKLSHFGLTLALDNAVAGPQKHDILNVLHNAETITNPSSEKTTIDPGLIVDNRSVRQRLASARISMHVGERTVLKSITRIQEWRKTVIVTERKRLRKTILDLRENRRQISRLHEWTLLLTSERGLWTHGKPRFWRLDETEGPFRIRKKLEPDNEKTLSSRAENDEHTRDVQEPDFDAQSVIQVEAPSWAEGYEISATNIEEDRQLAEEITEDKHRRVRHELEPGDIIEAVSTVARVAGVDSSPGLLIFGRTHLYMLDGLVENDDGEVIDAHDAPRRLFFVPGSIVELDGPQRAQRWTHMQIASFSERTFLFRDVALEIYFKDSRSLLIVFLDKARRRDMYHRLAIIVGLNSPEPLTPGLLLSPILGKALSAKMLLPSPADELSTAQRKWQAREISNFTYLSIINQISGRTPSDATQYPIFPWVLKDYTSETLDLTSPDSYRDLTKPMGALSPSRCEAAQTRYANLESVNEQPFHYGTHFSSSMIVCHFLIRLAPFTNMFKTLQGGDWDLPDRLFNDLPRAYESAAHEGRGDVRELIPEFFTCPEFLENSSNLDFGIQQNTGERINDVKLPPWAKQDPLLFITLNRKALESDYVSQHLPAWIDLIWGYKQRDRESLNAFHPLSYEGSIDLDTITDELEREATVGIIHNFGQTPRKLFPAPHPHRYTSGLSTLPIGNLHGIEEDSHLLVQANRPLKNLGLEFPVRSLVIDTIGERVIPCPEGVLCAPVYTHEQVEWGPSRTGAGELRVVVDQKVVQVVEAAFCTCAAFADSENLVTGSSDHTIRLWRITRRSPNNTGASSSTNIKLSHIMRVHTKAVVCVTASRAWSIAVSGSKDGSTALWDLNRGVYVRSIWHGEDEEYSTVHLVAINESTGYIATCSRTKLCLHTINARPMATLDLTTLPAFSNLFPPITSLAFHEREYSRLGVLATGGPDGTITFRTWTTDGTPIGEKAQWKFVTIRNLKIRALERAGTMPSVTVLKFIGESLCHGEDTGKAFLWHLPD